MQKHPLQSLKGVGPQLVTKLEKLGITHPVDLLFHLPYRYQDRTRVHPIGSLQPGQQTLILAQILIADIRFGRRRSLLVRVSDDTGQLTLRFFHFNKSQQQGFIKGNWIQCFGEVRRGPQTLEMVHPEYRIFQEPPEVATEQSLTPVYPSTEGIGPIMIRRLVKQALETELHKLHPLFPKSLLDKFSLSSLQEALSTLHNPPPDADRDLLLKGQHPDQQRLALEELLAHHMALAQLREFRQQKHSPTLNNEMTLWRQLESSLEFTLTNAQTRVIEEVRQDISKAIPALRLIQGDVGSGKTIVAAAAALQAIESGYQVAIMAPTELLAEQHRKNFCNWFERLNIQVDWLTGKSTQPERRAVLSRLQSGECDLVLGTHALFQEQVEFNKLGLIIVDEQHRFGVNQRLALRQKGDASETVPHQLIMSATPIPRSMAMIFYADMDVSGIDELPPGRLPVNTVVISNNRRNEVAERIYRNCLQGNQAYWVCPLIEESDKLQAQAATEVFNALETQLPDLSVALIHGRLKAAEKDQIMRQFRQGEIQLLVATTVIEVGVDVPNANLMVIENAERLGLAQLHQLRGRVGRGAEQASCVLLYQSPLGQLAKQRLEVLRQTNDGFVIAEKDLEQRGPGEMLGTRQTGLQQMKIADLHRDRGLLPRVEKISQVIRQQHPDIIPQLISRWINQHQNYANV